MAKAEAIVPPPFPPNRIIRDGGNPMNKESPTLLETPPQETQAIAPSNPPSDLVLMLERVATNKDVDVDKLERLIQMQERILDRNAKSAFDAAFATMQPEIPEIDERGRIMIGTELRSKYALNEDIQKVLKPILAKHGFSLRFRVEWPSEKRVRVVGILAHRDGHAEQSEFLSDADSSGGKNAIQGLGSAISYGHRYTTCDLLNITSRGQDDDGQKGGTKFVDAPEGFEDWLADMDSMVEEGCDIAQLRQAWEGSKESYRKYVARDKNLVKKSEHWKSKARAVKS